MWGAALSAWAVVGLLACLQPGAAARRWIGLGLLLGQGLLTKYNTGVVALASGLAIGVQDVVRLGASPRAGLRVSVLTAVNLGVAGWYFGWNLHLYGRPILMQNEIVTAHMARSGYGPTRPLAGYLSLRPEILQLELDMLLNDESHPEARAAVWPVTFGAVWFDLHSTVLLAPNRNAQSAARILYACGALWTVLALWGAVALLRPPRGSPAVVGAAALALVIVLTLASYGAFTWRVATFSALKGTYLSPSILPWCVFAGAGCDRLASHGGAARAALAALVAGFVVTVTAIYWVGWLAPLPFNPGAYYPNAWSDGATERVTDFFLPPGAIEEAARRYR
jgi:hypothetical protein